MLIFKSFFRKKTTKNYLIIYSFIILAIFVLIFGKEIINNKYNDLYNGSFITVNEKDYAKIKDINGIDKSYEALQINVDERLYNYVYLIKNESLKDDEIIIAEESKKEEQNVIEIELQEKYYVFNIKDYSKEINNRNIIYVSKNIYESIKPNGKMVYIFTLKNWIESKKIDSIISKKIGVNNYIHYVRGTNNNYEKYLSVLNVLLFTLIVLFIIVLIFTSYNSIQDENKKNIIYYRIGYNKRKLKIYNFAKIFMLLLLSSIIAKILAIIIKLIYNIFLV